jgi:DNA-binding CsgD family transcriptional regulator
VLADTVRDELADAARAGARGMTRLVGAEEVVDVLATLEPRARRSVWNMSPRMTFDPQDPGFDLAESSVARGVDSQIVTRAISLRVNPLLGSIYPQVRIGPVFLHGVIVDQTTLVVEGLDTLDGYLTAWLTDRTDFVVPLLEIWRRCFSLSRPLLAPGQEPPLTRRQLRVARMMARGEKDQTIARTLNLSARTVEREVRAILEELGARGRTEAVMLMRGRGLAGGRPESRHPGLDG